MPVTFASSLGSRPTITGLLIAVSLVLAPSALQAQDATEAAVASEKMVFHACYDPAVGALYLIRQPGLATKCLKPSHAEIVLRGAPSNDPGAATVPSGPAGGDLSGTYPDPTVARLQGSPVATTAPVQGQAMFFAGGQWRPVTPAFGGDVTGGINTLKVVKLQNQAVSATAPTAGQAMLWDGVNLAWTPGTLPSGVTAHNQLTGLAADDHPQYLLTNGSRVLTGSLSLGGNKITGLAAATAAGEAVRWEQTVKVGDGATGDLAGIYPNPAVAKLRGFNVSPTTPTAGQVLTWNAGTTSWTPQTPAAGVTAHSQLTGLTADDHSQYLLLNANRTAIDGFAVTGVLNQGALAASSSGTRMLWYPRKAAFRAGYVAGTEWDDASIGSFSLAGGYSSKASGLYSVATGYFSVATGNASVAMGWSSQATRPYGVALGYYNTAGASSSCVPDCAETAIGSLNVASGAGATAIGYRTSASGAQAVALGRSGTASGTASFVAGYTPTASGFASTAFGNSTSASGNYSVAMNSAASATGLATTAMGSSTTANSAYSLALGLYNYDPGSPTLWVSTDPILTIGNGSPTVRANVFRILKNGEVYANGSFHSSDLRLKEDIRPLTDVLSRLQGVRGVTFKWRDLARQDTRVQVGMIAQEVQRAFPELVREDERGYLSVSYANFTAVLLAAIQEQQQQIAELRAALAALPQGPTDVRRP